MVGNIWINCFDILTNEYWKVTTICVKVIPQSILESFRLKDEDNYEDNI